MVIFKKCRLCLRSIKLIKTDERASNGAIVFIDEKGRKQCGHACRDCVQAKRDPHWMKAWTAKYEKTEFGYLVRKYRNMLSRVRGVQGKHHLYLGLPILPKQQFYDWASSHKDFKILFEAYKNSNYERKLAPSVDRIDPTRGYTLDNMRWVTHSENSRNTRQRLKDY